MADDCDIHDEMEALVLGRRLAAIRAEVQAQPNAAALAVGEPVDCEDCDNQIEPARLEVHPAATCCVRCQSLREKTAAGRRAPVGLSYFGRQSVIS